MFGEGGKQSVQNSTESCNIIDMYHKKEIYRDYLELYNIYIKNHADKSTQSDMNKIDSTVTEEILPRNFFTILFNFSRFVNFSVKSNFIPQKTISTFKPFYNKFYDKQYLFKPGAGSDNERYTKFKTILDEIRQIDNKFPVIHNDDLFKGDSFVDIKDFIKLLFCFLILDLFIGFLLKIKSDSIEFISSSLYDILNFFKVLFLNYFYVQ